MSEYYPYDLGTATNPRKRIFSAALSLCLPLLVALVCLQMVQAESGETTQTITVCPDGPPACDYSHIQEGIDNALDGDAVLVANGTYQENLQLKSGISIESIEGPEETVLWSTIGPIISGTSVVSTSIQGLHINGIGTALNGTAIALHDSEVALSHMVIDNFAGLAGHEFHPDGFDVIGVHSTGIISLTIENSTISTLKAGDGWSGGEGSTGGRSVGILMSGDGQSVIISSTIDDLRGGAAGAVNWGGYWCDGVGGAAKGIVSDGDIELTLRGTTISDLHSGAPCWGSAGCGGPAGIVVGVDSHGGVVYLEDNLFTTFHPITSWGGVEHYGVRTTISRGTYLNHNRFDSTFTSYYTATPSRMLSPYCGSSPLKVNTVASIDDALLQMDGNTIHDIRGKGPYGYSRGILVRGTSSVSLQRNSITHILGGYGTLTTIGADIGDSQYVTFESNYVSDLQAANAVYETYYLMFGEDGGSVAALSLVDVAFASIVNNRITNLMAGNGGRPGYPNITPGPDGGDSVAIRLVRSAAIVQNNVAADTAGGDGGPGTPPGAPGTGVGLYVSVIESAVHNNVFTNHQVGIFSDNAASFEPNHNNLWANAQDYEGVLPGTQDLHTDPLWADSQYHLSPNSPLIDAGTSLAASGQDFELDPRPADGNGDGILAVDIGVDEYCAGICGARLSVEPYFIDPGDTITYTVDIMNSYTAPFTGSLYLSDEIDPLTEYVPDSLTASSGEANYENGMISWTGTISPGGSVSISFQAATDPLLVEPYYVENEAVLSSDDGSAWHLRTVVWINPLQQYLPQIKKS